jgi:hypothetical protein
MKSSLLATAPAMLQVDNPVEFFGLINSEAPSSEGVRRAKLSKLDRQATEMSDARV